MKRLRFLPVVLLSAAALVLFTRNSRGGTYIVSARANIFGAGHVPPRDTPAPTGAGGGVPPVAITFPAAPNQVFIFTNVTGKVDFGNPTRPTGPDGGNFPYCVSSFRGIAGVKANCIGYLVGVFLDSAEPADPAPLPLDFTVIGTNFTSLSPRIGQVFFIGDGKTDKGVIQQFHAPSRATRLFLGLADSAHPRGGPGFYCDNTGWFSVTVERLQAGPDGSLVAANTTDTADTAGNTGAATATASPDPAVYAAPSETPPLPRDEAFGYAVPPGIGLTEQIEVSSDLIHWSSATNVNLFFKDPDSTNHTARFYRFQPFSIPGPGPAVLRR